MNAPIIKIFCFSKDEDKLIEDWILYHSYIVGYENIVILDNQSTISSVLEIYEKYKSRGIQVFSIGGNGEIDKASFMTDYMRQYKDVCDWLIPLDTDEFIFSNKHLLEGSDPTDRENILSVFKNIPQNQTNCKISSFPQSEVSTDNPFYIDNIVQRPVRNIITFAKDVTKSASCHWYHNCTKSFTRANAFVEIGVGNHFATVSHGYCANADIGYFHYHNIGSKDIFKRAERHMLFNKYLDNNADLNTIINKLPTINGLSHHRIWQYSYYITRMFIVKLFNDILHSYPSQEELSDLTNLLFHKSTSEIENYISTLSISLEPFIFNETIFNNLVFYEKLADPSNIITYDWVSKRMATLSD